MKHLLILSTIITFTTIMFFSSRITVYAAGHLQYDGVYACYDKGGDLPANMYYRFYPDNTVIEVASTGSLAEIRRWFHRDGAGTWGRGKITQIQGNKLSFYTRYGDGKLNKYSGEIDDNLIRIKESRYLWGKDTIVFIKFNEPTHIPECR